MSCEEQGEEEIQRAPENKPKRGHQQRESELQRIRESRGRNRVLFGFPLTLRHFSPFDTSFSL